MALAYEFQFPATHRKFKSLVYGDMNLVDWTGQDNPLNERSQMSVTRASNSCRFAWPRRPITSSKCCRDARPARASETLMKCWPSAKAPKASREVFDSSEPAERLKVLSPEKYYSLNGSGSDLRTLAVRTRIGCSS